jgi:hypothetical protein
MAWRGIVRKKKKLVDLAQDFRSLIGHSRALGRDDMSSLSTLLDAGSPLEVLLRAYIGQPIAPEYCR